MRELRGGRITTGSAASSEYWTTTFMVLDSWYCYDVVFQAESGDGHLGLNRLRANVADFCERLNAPPVPCAAANCENSLPVEYVQNGGNKRIYCSLECKVRQNQRRRVGRERKTQARAA